MRIEGYVAVRVRVVATGFEVGPDARQVVGGAEHEGDAVPVERRGDVADHRVRQELVRPVEADEVVVRVRTNLGRHIRCSHSGVLRSGSSKHRLSGALVGGYGAIRLLQPLRPVPTTDLVAPSLPGKRGLPSRRGAVGTLVP